MSVALLDTHAWYWLFTGERRLPEAATRYIEQASFAFVCSISLYEIARKAGIGKWPDMSGERLQRLVDASEEAGIDVVPASAEAMVVAGFLDWDHRDPWDRLIGAVTLDQGATLVSADTAFDDVRGLSRLWK